MLTKWEKEKELEEVNELNTYDDFRWWSGQTSETNYKIVIKKNFNGVYLLH